MIFTRLNSFQFPYSTTENLSPVKTIYQGTKFQPKLDKLKVNFDTKTKVSLLFPPFYYDLVLQVILL